MSGATPMKWQSLSVASARTQRGQALTEMAILAAVLVPLFLLIPMLAKYAHTRQVTQQTVRAAAWEATVADAYDWKSSINSTTWRERRQQLLVDRHFGDAETPIRSEPEQAQQDAKVAAVMMNTFSDQPLLTRNDIVLEAYGNESGGPLSNMLEGAGGLLETLPGEFPPNRDGLVTARMVVRPQNLKASDGSEASFLNPFDRLDLVMEDQHVLLADSWGAAGSGLIDAGTSSRNKRRVKDQVTSFVPSAWLGDEISGVLEDIDFMEDVPLIGVPFRIRPGYMQPDIVPHDRLQKYQP